MSSSTLANSLQGRISSLLCAGMAQSAVASIVGVDASYISQLMADESFSSAVILARAAKSEKELARDNRLDSLEDLLIDRMEKLTKQPHVFMKPMEALRALQTINGLKRKASNLVAASQGDGMGSTVIELTLPSFIVQNFYAPVLDINNNVVKIGDNDLVTIQSSQMANLANTLTTGHSNDRSNTPQLTATKSQSQPLSISDII